MLVAPFRLSLHSHWRGADILPGLLSSAAVARLGLGAAASVGLVLASLSALLVWRWLPETRVRRPSFSAIDAWRQAVSSEHNAGLRRSVGAVLSGTLLHAVFLLALPLYLARMLGYAEDRAIPTIAGLFVLAAVFQSLLLPRLLPRIGDRHAALFGFLSVTLGSIGIAAPLSCSSCWWPAGLSCWASPRSRRPCRACSARPTAASTRAR